MKGLSKKEKKREREKTHGHGRQCGDLGTGVEGGIEAINGDGNKIKQSKIK